MSVIKTEKLTKYYGKSRGIIDLDLIVEQGEIFGFIGPNGAGKSTTIRTLLGMISVSSGNAEIFDKDIKTDKKFILSKIGYMPSEAVFYNGMKVKDIISLSARLHKKVCTEEANTLCERFSLDVNKKVDELSLGNRKKVAIVCAFQHKPDLYILDEPTSGLDPLMQKEFFDLINERNREGATFFLSSHVLNEIQKNCSKAAIIREGRLIACDSVENLSQTSAKRVTLTGTQSAPQLKGIKGISSGDNSVKFLYQGNVRELLSALQEINITDLTITEPELDEIFMHYYEKDGE